jgi:acid phosphatase
MTHAAFPLGVILALPLLAQTPPVMDGLNATAWMETSVEYRVSALQAWKLAHFALPAALKDKRWTAALEQTGDFAKLPPALIVDIDETVLDNSPGQARFLLEGSGRFNFTIWGQWTAEHKAKPVPGALEFLREADAQGVTVFYVTNRGIKDQDVTRLNLTEQGFPVKAAAADLGDTLLMSGEKEGWTSDKSSRRAAIAKYYRVLFLCGDDLNDFFSAKLPLAERATKAREHEAWFGERWIMLPNPAYGSWEDALYDYDRMLPAAAVEQRKLKALRRD